MNAETERAAIVKYLREVGELYDSYTRTNKRERLKNRFHAESCNLSAEAIERGDHHEKMPQYQRDQINKGQG